MMKVPNMSYRLRRSPAGRRGAAFASRTAMLIACAGVLSAHAPAPEPADLIVTADRIYTVDPTHPVVGAVAIRAGKVVFAGSEQQALVFKGSATRVRDFAGRTVIPGLADAHGHMMGLGFALQQVDLVGASSYDEVIARVVARAKTARPGEWILGHGWDQNRWPDTHFPTHDALSKAVPDHPVVLTRIDGHALLANARAMAAAKIGTGVKDPDGGRVLRTAKGEPTGVFIDRAQGLVRQAIPPPTPEESRTALLKAVAYANSWGLVSVHDAGESRKTIELYDDLARTSALSLRAYVMIADDSADLAYFFQRGPQSAMYDGHLWVRSVKLYADGALGSRGAALLEPYSDDPGNSGLLVSTPDHLRSVAVAALRSGFQVCTHAIGDRGNRVALDAYEAALRDVPVADHRFRIEHAQILNHADIPRFAQLGVIPSMQTVHQASDMYWAGSRLGSDRLYGAYAWRSLLETGVIIPNGSDFPVEQVNPLLSFHAAITRQDARNWPPGGWRPGERMTRDEALLAMTLWPAYAAFAEGVMGSLSAGKYADFVVLDQDIMRVAPEQILATRVVATFIGGTPVYEQASPAPGAKQ